MSLMTGWPCNKCGHMATNHATLVDHLMYSHPRMPDSKCEGCGQRITMGEDGAWRSRAERLTPGSSWCSTINAHHRPLVIDPLLDEVQEVEQEMKAKLLAIRDKLR